MTQSLLFANPPVLPYSVPPGCGPCDRTEIPISIRKNGRIYRFVLRDKITVEDPYLILVKAAGFAIAQGEPYSGTPPPRTVKDFLIKSNVVI